MNQPKKRHLTQRQTTTSRVVVLCHMLIDSELPGINPERSEWIVEYLIDTDLKKNISASLDLGEILAFMKRTAQILEKFLDIIGAVELTVPGWPLPITTTGETLQRMLREQSATFR